MTEVRTSEFLPQFVTNNCYSRSTNSTHVFLREVVSSTKGEHCENARNESFKLYKTDVCLQSLVEFRIEASKNCSRRKAAFSSSKLCRYRKGWYKQSLTCHTIKPCVCVCVCVCVYCLINIYLHSKSHSLREQYMGTSGCCLCSGQQLFILLPM